jgi:molybdopterin-containing oxidoreductase family iron-sulfur binding subunit
MPMLQSAGLKELANALNNGQVETLFVLGANPAHTGPADLDFNETLRKAKSIVHLGMYFDETAQLAEWHIPQSHYLEMWSDVRTYDGTATVIQPLIAPLYDSHSAHEILQAMLENPVLSPMDAVRANWPQLKDEMTWRKTLEQGWIDGTTATPKSGGMKAASVPILQASGLEIVFRPDTQIWDGRYANIGWMQEIPRPVTNMSWDNAAMMSIPTAVQYKLEEGDVIELKLHDRVVNAPVFVVPGSADNLVTVLLGYGRKEGGRIGSGVGFNAYELRTVDAPLHDSGLTLRKTGDTYPVCVTKSHYTDTRSIMAGGPGPGTNRSLEGDEAADRQIIRWATLEEFQKNPDFAHEGEMRETPPDSETLLHDWNYTTDSKGKDKYAWAMSIDMNSCIGCNACIASCYAENNIPVIGREQVKIGRIMQWIRVDTYFEGDLDAPKAHFQPMTCQHCEHAGCEQVCPVGATVHSPEGLNLMVYNRCVGTRYCSNNCPYKVRRFNWLLYSDYDTESYKLMRNPDVSVRSRGVMEKCSYCTQRIEAAKIEADKENRLVRDGDIVTACQQACPTNAIMFGNINDAQSKVSRAKASKRTYQVLADLDYRPRTTYVAEVLNPNPVGEEGAAG